jgi:predicted 3-demethylubiquinone-9 3-methyltransferase (glyoxalase superfamily)
MSKITTCLWFDGKAEEAARFYVSLLPDSRIESIVPYVMDMPGGTAGDTMLVEFTLAGQHCIALNGGAYFQFTPAMSLVVNCADQAEIDRLWDALTEGGSAMPCGWLTDCYGVAWQIVPEALPAMMKSGDPAKARRVTEAMLPMTKIDIATLRAAFEGGSAAAA